MTKYLIATFCITYSCISFACSDMSSAELNWKNNCIAQLSTDLVSRGRALNDSSKSSIRNKCLCGLNLVDINKVKKKGYVDKDCNVDFQAVRLVLATNAYKIQCE